MSDSADSSQPSQPWADLSDAKFRVLLCESALLKARAALTSCEVDLKVARLRVAGLEKAALETKGDK